MKDKNFREDENLRVANERHAGVVIKNSKILLVHRIKDSFEYYVFPGGHRRRDEKGKKAVIREIREETGITVEDPGLIFEFKNYKSNNFDFYYICKWKSGDKPFLNGEEAVRSCKENFFKPMWVELDKIPEINLLPKFAKEWLEINLEWVKKSIS